MIGQVSALKCRMTIAYDLRHALRTLWKSPGFASAAVLSLAVGIGANAAIFSIVNSLFLHPPGIEQPAKVVAPRVSYKKLNLIQIQMSATDFADVRQSTGEFSKTAMARGRGFNYTGGDSPERLVGTEVTWQWFDVFGARPILGRTFRSEEDQPAANQVVVLSYETWHRLFGGDRSVLGRALELNQKTYRVIGVMPPNFHWPTEAQLWAPMGLEPDKFGPANRFNESFTVVARLREGVSYQSAAAFMKLLTKRAEDSNAEVGDFAKRAQWSMGLEPFTELNGGSVETPMLILLGAVAFVLLIACSNIAGLMLVRATGRARELAIRMSLGASRGDKLPQIRQDSRFPRRQGAEWSCAAALARRSAKKSSTPWRRSVSTRASWNWSYVPVGQPQVIELFGRRWRPAAREGGLRIHSCVLDQWLFGRHRGQALGGSDGGRVQAGA